MQQPYLNNCKCGNRPERVTLAKPGMVRIGCVLARCPELIVAQWDIVSRLWNDMNPEDEVPTIPNNTVPQAEPYRGPWGSVVNTSKTLLAIDVKE
jgi:hypothetical protein